MKINQRGAVFVIFCFIILFLVSYVSFAAAVITYSNKTCICEVYKSPPPFANAQKFQVASSLDRCNSTCYDKEGVMRQACYEDGVMYAHFYCDKCDECPGERACTSAEQTSCSGVGIVYAPHYGGWDDSSGEGCTDACDGKNDSSYTCTSSDITNNKECRDVKDEYSDNGSAYCEKRSVDCAYPHTTYYWGLYNMKIDTIIKDAKQVQCSSFVYQTKDNVPRAWHDSAAVGYKCCGDDLPSSMDISKYGVNYTDIPNLDGGTLTSLDPNKGAFLCANDTGNNWQWFNKDSVIGDVFYIGYGNYEVISAEDPYSPGASKWYACDSKNDGTLNFNAAYGGEVKQEGESVAAGNYYYLCFTNESYEGSTERFAECNGNDNSPNNDNYPKYGVIKKTGQSVWLPSKQEYRFCTSQYWWTDDLDTSNLDTCEVEFKWTGSQCCGDDAEKDIYNDKGWQLLSPSQTGSIIGGCFRSIRVENNTLIADANIVKNGDFEQALNFWTRQGTAVPAAGQLQLTKTANVVALVRQDVTKYIYPGKLYALTAMVYVPSDVTARVSIFADGNEIQSSIIEPSSYSQETKTVYFNAPNNFNKIEVYARAIGKDGTAYFDDIKLRFAKRNIMNLDGNFIGCNMSEDERKGYEERDTKGNIIGYLISPERIKGVCTVTGDYFCSETFGWSNELEGAPDIYSRNTPKSTPELYPNFSASCCPAEYCWNGSWCVESEHYSTDPINPIWIDENSLYRCIHGNWDLTTIKWTWDNKQFGYCPSTTQCLVDKNGNADNNNMPGEYKGPLNAENPQCIENNQFIQDHLCDNGTWTTRTKHLAVELMTLIDERSNKDNYVLLCGNYSSALNLYNYQTLTGVKVEDYVRGKFYQMGPLSTYSCSGDPAYIMPCTNNFCVLFYHDKYDDEDKVVLATSLNKPVNADEFSFLETLNKDKNYCDDLIGTGSMFSKCSGDDRIWYDDESGLIMISPHRIDLEAPAWQSFLNWLVNPIESLLGAIHPTAMGSVPLVYEAKDYNTIYANVFGSKTITGVMELAALNPFLTVSYSGFTQDICKTVDVYDKAKFGGAKLIACNQTDSKFYVYSQGRAALVLWQDLTAKTRISGDYYSGESPGFAQQ